MKDYICELCKREGIIKITEHHLVPKEVGGGKLPVALLCQDCHKQIHALYTNKELAMRLNTIAALEKDERVARYLRYIKNQPPNKNITIKKSRAVRKKGIR